MNRFLPTIVAGLLVLTACNTNLVNNVDDSQNYNISAASLAVDGPYEIRSYLPPQAAEFSGATIYYPIDAESPVGGVAISPGYTHRQRNINWWGPRLASHGFAILTLDTNQPGDRPQTRAIALIAALEMLKSENGRSGSPFYGKLDENKLAVMGHSMGGGGTLLAANQLGNQIKAAIPLNSWQPDPNFDQIVVPTLFIAGSADRVAPSNDHAWPHFQTLPDSTTRVYMEVDGGDHYIANSGRNKDHATIGRYGIAWLKLYLDGDQRYSDFIYGEAAQLDRGKFSRYITHP